MTKKRPIYAYYAALAERVPVVRNLRDVALTAEQTARDAQDSFEMAESHLLDTSLLSSGHAGARAAYDAAGHAFHSAKLALYAPGVTSQPSLASWSNLVTFQKSFMGSHQCPRAARSIPNDRRVALVRRSTEQRCWI